jgi:soluble lytic murein transglycosylase-like protein
VIGFVLSLGLVVADLPAAREAYDFCAATAKQAYALVLDGAPAGLVVEAEPAPTEAAPVAEMQQEEAAPVAEGRPAAETDDLAAVTAAYHTVTAVAVNVAEAAVDRLWAALGDEPAAEATAPAGPHLGVLYGRLAANARQAVAEGIGACHIALRRPPPPPAKPQQFATGDALKPVISEAAQRFDLPELWIRAVMRVESNGDAAATSPKGAMGLMQVMPATYADLSARHGLGEDGYELRNNVLAGSAYLREMYDRYGAAGFLAAYNAGPGRYEDSFCRRCTLPSETRRYVASVRLAFGEILFGDPGSRYYEPLAVAKNGALLLERTGKPVPVAERLALHSLVERAVKRAGRK